MSYFSIMLIPDAGQTKTYRFSSGKLRLILITLALCIILGGLGAYNIYANYSLRQTLHTTQQIIQNERITFAHQKEIFESSLQAEAEKMNVYARSLGQMQARLSRLDSLGKRLVETSSLTSSEFDFDVQPAFGGPRLASEHDEVDLMLVDQMQRVNSKIALLDTNLIAINYLLQDNIDESKARPHAWPSEGGWLSSKYGVRTDPFTSQPAVHRGIDIANRFGTPVLSGSRGVVIYAGKVKDYGYMIEIEHGYGYRTRYGHMSGITVNVGDVVNANDVIGRVGSTGRSTGPHLHYEVLRNNETLNPERFITKG